MTPTVTRLDTKYVTHLTNVNHGLVTYDPKTGRSTLRTSHTAAPVDVTAIADEVDALRPALVDAPRDAAGTWRLTDDGIQVLVRQGARA